MPLVCCGAPTNDIYRLLCADGASPPRYETAEEAISRAPRGAGVLLFAEGYPDQSLPMTPTLFAQAAENELRLFVEFPSLLPGLALGNPRYIRTGGYQAIIERTVVTSSSFGSELPRGCILMAHDCTVLPSSASNPHLVLAQVVGYDCAELGVPDDATPLLFELPDTPVLVAATRLSQCITGRFAPVGAWATVWQMILQWLQPDIPVKALSWAPTIRPTFSPGEPLPVDAERTALARATGWYTRSRLLPNPSWPEWVISENPGTLPLPPDWPTGDGSCGIAECYISKRIFRDGNQPVHRCVRADCTGEAGMGLALSSAVASNADDAAIAERLMDFLWLHSNMPRRDPIDPTYGLVGHNTKTPDQYYADDNARVVLGSLTASAILRIHRWDIHILRAILANFRCTGPKGYQPAACLDDALLADGGWERCWQWDGTHFSPHFQSFIWATYLWLYAQTGFAPLLERARTGMRLMMAAYPDGWRNECGRMEEERIHMLLPLAWLVRVEDTPEHRAWLRLMSDYVMAQVNDLGAIPQQVDAPARQNRDYGAGEAPVAYRSGDPVTDLLYSMNFAFIGMHEAVAATGDTDYRRITDLMATFLVRCQTQSDAHPELDGTWFRAFDFAKWEFWGSDGDAGWGAWTTEVGWTHSWITATLALRQLNTSLWDVCRRATAAQLFVSLHQEMLPHE